MRRERRPRVGSTAAPAWRARRGSDGGERARAAVLSVAHITWATPMGWPSSVIPAGSSPRRNRVDQVLVEIGAALRAHISTPPSRQAGARGRAVQRTIDRSRDRAFVWKGRGFGLSLLVGAAEESSSSTRAWRRRSPSGENEAAQRGHGGQQSLVIQPRLEKKREVRAATAREEASGAADARAC